MANKETIKSIFGILLGAVAIFAVKSIFESDNSKIVSRKGRKILSDDEKMDDINEKIEESENSNDRSEVFI